jgi:DNA-directed RNA polymerase specialized sigma24 family protein
VHAADGFTAVLLDEAFDQLERECAANGMGRTFEGLKSLVMCEGELSYAGTALKLQLTETNVKVTVHRLRQRLRDLLRGVIEKSGTPRGEVDGELHELCAVLRQ